MYPSGITTLRCQSVHSFSLIELGCILCKELLDDSLVEPRGWVVFQHITHRFDQSDSTGCWCLRLHLCICGGGSEVHNSQLQDLSVTISVPSTEDPAHTSLSRVSFSCRNYAQTSQELSC